MKYTWYAKRPGLDKKLAGTWRSWAFTVWQLTRAHEQPHVPIQCPLPHHAYSAGLCSSGRQAARLFSVPHVVQQETTLAYLENQVAAALTLQSSHEYRHWLLLYARYLVNEGEQPQVAFCPCVLQSLAQFLKLKEEPRALYSLVHSSGISQAFFQGPCLLLPFPDKLSSLAPFPRVSLRHLASLLTLEPKLHGPENVPLETQEDWQQGARMDYMHVCLKAAKSVCCLLPSIIHWQH